MKVGIALIGPLAVLALPAEPPLPAPLTTKYRIETRVEQVQDLSAFGQGEQSIVQDQAALITISLTDSAGGRAMHVVVDSVASSGPMAPPAAALEGLKGAWLHGFLDGQGRARILATSNDTSDVLAQLRATLHSFHPRVKPGFSKGDSWTDTTVVESKSSSQATTTTMVTSYTAAGEESVSGATARRLETRFTGLVKGKIQNPMAGELDLEARETGTGVYYLGPDGRFLGGSATGSGNATVTSPMLPGPIPIKTSRVSKVVLVN